MLLGGATLSIKYGGGTSLLSSIQGDLAAGRIVDSIGGKTPRTNVAGGVVQVSKTFPASSPGDANGDGKVNFSDLLILAQHYGKPGSLSDGDLTGDGKVDFADLLILAQHYGKSATSAFATAILSPTRRRQP